MLDRLLPGTVAERQVQSHGRRPRHDRLCRRPPGRPRRPHRHVRKRRWNIRAPTGHDFRVRRADGALSVLELVTNNLLNDTSVRAVAIERADVTERRLGAETNPDPGRLLDYIVSGARLEETLKQYRGELEAFVSDLPCLVILNDESVSIIATGDRLPAKVSATWLDWHLRGTVVRWFRSVTGDDPVIGDLRADTAWPPAEMLETRCGLRAFSGVPIPDSARSESIGAVLFSLSPVCNPASMTSRLLDSGHGSPPWPSTATGQKRRLNITPSTTRLPICQPNSAAGSRDACHCAGTSHEVHHRIDDGRSRLLQIDQRQPWTRRWRSSIDRGWEALSQRATSERHGCSNGRRRVRHTV